MSPDELKAFQDGKMLTWATRLNDWGKLDAWMADAIRAGVYMNPTMNYAR
jgi:hypothetical protein